MQRCALFAANGSMASAPRWSSPLVRPALSLSRTSSHITSVLVEGVESRERAVYILALAWVLDRLMRRAHF
jgi:hypothetical protein